MEQKKTNKKKLVIALALLALIVVASVITTVVLVLAANQQNVQSSVTVTYSVTDVSATVYGRYAQKPTTSGATTINDWTEMTDDGITFTPEQGTTTGSMNAASITLSSVSDYVVFQYEFVNNATASENDKSNFTINLQYKDDDSADDTKKDINVAVGYISSKTEINTFDVYDRAANEWSSGFAELPTDNSQVACDTCLSQENNNHVYVYVVVAVKSLSTAARFSGAFNFTLAAASNNA